MPSTMQHHLHTLVGLSAALRCGDCGRDLPVCGLACIVDGCGYVTCGCRGPGLVPDPDEWHDGRHDRYNDSELPNSSIHDNGLTKGERE
jgi:hypothetical protein